MRPWLLAAGLLALVAILAVGFWIVRPGGQPRLLFYYRLVDADTLIVGVEDSDTEEIRVTGVEETADSVTITVQPFTDVFGPAAGGAFVAELEVDLQQPLGDRGVFDPHHAVPLQPTDQ